MNWYIGQDIVAVRSHSQGVFKKGDVFAIQALRQSPCCKHILIHVGIYGSNKNTDCSCGVITKEADTTHWFHETNFAPIAELKEEIAELLEETGVITA